MSNDSNRWPDARSDNFVDLAIDNIRSSQPPAGSCERLINLASMWDQDVIVSTTSRSTRKVVFALASSIAATFAIAFWFWWPSQRQAITDFDVATQQSVAGQKDRPLTFAIPGPMAHTAVAEVQTIVASTGAIGPAKLGGEVKHIDFNKDLDASLVRLHLWDWSKSDLSSVRVVKRSDLGVLSADGRMMLAPSGLLLDLNSLDRRQLPGFDLKDGQHTTALGLSPSGRYGWLMIQMRMRSDSIGDRPNIEGSAYYWMLRVVDTTQGRTVGEFPAHAACPVCFTPKEDHFLYCNEEERIVLCDVLSGKVLNVFEPTLGRQSGVGLAISRDGHLVAAAHYYGRLFVWETSTGRIVLQHQFKRSNGEEDIFFQAKLMSFSSDGNRIAVVSGNRIKVLEVPNGSVLAEHYDATTPDFIQVRWSEAPDKLVLISPSAPSKFQIGAGFPGIATADTLPRVFEWSWKSDKDQMKEIRIEQ